MHEHGPDRASVPDQRARTLALPLRVRQWRHYAHLERRPSQPAPGTVSLLLRPAPAGHRRLAPRSPRARPRLQFRVLVAQGDSGRRRIRARARRAPDARGPGELRVRDQGHRSRPLPLRARQHLVVPRQRRLRRRPVPRFPLPRLQADRTLRGDGTVGRGHPRHRHQGLEHPRRLFRDPSREPGRSEERPGPRNVLPPDPPGGRHPGRPVRLPDRPARPRPGEHGGHEGLRSRNSASPSSAPRRPT